MNELRLIEGTKEERDQFVSRIDVLEKVKELNTLAGTDYITTNQLARFYEVPISTVRNIYNDHLEEFISDGVEKIKGSKIRKLFSTSDYPTSQERGYLLIDGERIANSKNNLFPKRAVLRIGMLLRDSPIAKEVRTLLLNVYHDVEQGKENIIENINKEYSQEEELILKKVKAEVNGDYGKVSELNAKLFDLKNKRIKELEPKAEYTEEVLMADNLLTTTQIAKHYGMSARGLNSLLHDLKVQYRQSGQWFLYSKYQDKGYTSTQTFILQNGQTRMNTKWTEKGRMFIHELLEEEGLAN